MEKSALVRITPAGAGKTISLCPDRAIARDHPRRCGENSKKRLTGAKKVGSPPQVRGKLSAYAQIGQLQGITPAGAGKTRRQATLDDTAQDHPRRCGENSVALWAWRGSVGSPPQVRGKPDDRTVIIGTNGITPAGAGKTAAGQGGKGYTEDHPRRCGENAGVRSACRRLPGSPPQVRGKPPSLSVSCAMGRITPAGAGKTGTHHAAS